MAGLDCRLPNNFTKQAPDILYCFKYRCKLFAWTTDQTRPPKRS